jgi:YVTN family beta-propeller protein
MKSIWLAAPLAAVSLWSAAAAPPERPGPLPSGAALLADGWRLRPAGRQVPLSAFPMSSALSRDGKYLLVLNAGSEPPSISVLDTSTAVETSRVPVPGAWLGLTFTPRGDRVYAGGGAEAAVFEFNFFEGKLTPARTFPIVAPAKRTPQDFIGDVAFDPSGRLLYAADLFHDSIVIINPQTGAVTDRFPTGRRPYRILFHPDGQSLFVSSWADGAVCHHAAETGKPIQKLRLGAHPTDMVWLPGVPAEGEKPDWTARLLVAAAGTNNVYVVGVSEAKSLRQVEAINVSLTAWQPAGMTPSALALSPDAKRLYIACSGANAVAVADVTGQRTVPLGFLPTAWYPTGVTALANGGIVILNARGPRSSNGAAAFVDLPADDELAVYSNTVLENMPYKDALLSDAGTGTANPIPPRPGDPTPIAHVIYILKEGRTYDQVLGDLKPGNGDASLVRFGERVTPNHHRLARDFVLFDNFYAAGSSVATGHQWATAAIASDFVERMGSAIPGYEGQEPAATPSSGYLWTQAAAAGLSVRNYGFFTMNRPLATVKDGVHVATVRDPILGRSTSPNFRGVDPAYPDTERAKVFLDDLAVCEKTGQFPQLIVMRLGNDRAPGTVADNDAALGKIVEGVSKSRFWASTAIFVVEAAPLDGGDHVDPQRAVALVISPYAKRGVVDSTMYNTASMLRSMELILGLRPMTVFDAGARPLAAAFQSTPDTRPYQAIATGLVSQPVPADR